MEATHISTRFDKDLQRIQTLVLNMGKLTGEQISQATTALKDQDRELPREVISKDQKINKLETKIDEYAVRLIALRQPMAEDLRYAIAPIKISSDLERIGDHAKAIAVHQIRLSKSNSTMASASIKTLVRMSRIVQEMLENGLKAYAESDVQLAIQVHERDADVDEMNASLFRELLTYMMENPRNIEGCMHLLFVARSFERIGDHICNLAEQVYFLVQGDLYEDSKTQDDS